MKMSEETKTKLFVILAELFKSIESESITDCSTKPPDNNAKVEMLTIKECTELVSGISEHTIRKWIAQNKVSYIRTGEGKRGKILVNKASLLSMVGAVS